MTMTHKKKVLVLGATGSIGSSAIDILKAYPDRYELTGITAHTDAVALQRIKKDFPNCATCLSSISGKKSFLDFIEKSDADIVINGIAGASGLLPSRAALESGKHLALANKETIVMAGPLIRKLAKERGVHILPVDSEHSAVFSLIQAHGAERIKEIILTASGGPFRNYSREELDNVQLSDALNHPTWSMGPKITIDSASLANKGLEVIEACRLFDVPAERVKVVIHPQSLVHSLVRTTDGVLYAQMSPPDMRHPIALALSWPDCLPGNLKELDFSQAVSMDFLPPRHDAFPLLGMAYRAAALSGGYTIAFNAANEIAVEAFIQKKISFTAIAQVTARVMERDWTKEPDSFEEILEIDGCARNYASGEIRSLDS